MSHRDTTFKGCSSRLKSVEFETGDEIVRELTVTFEGTAGYKFESYTSIDGAIEYELDDEPVTLQYLYDLFGTSEVDKAILEAEACADQEG